MTRLTIIANGTRGDVQPAIAVGRALLAAGYAVRVLAAAGFRDWIESHGLEAAPSAIDMEALMRSERGRRWVERGRNPLAEVRVMRELLDEHGPQLVREGWEASDGADAVLSSFTSDAYAVAIGEGRDIPVVSLLLQPAMIATRDGRAMPGAPRPDRVSRLNAAFGRLVIEPFPWRLYGPATNALRRELGLAPQTAARNAAARRRMTVLHGVSRHVLPRAADWPARYHVTGYWFLDEGGAWQPPGELTAFLEAGAPPVAIGFGSMTSSDPAAMTRLVVDAARASGRRAILLTGWAQMETRALGRDVVALPAAPHDWLYPRVAAAVHHGGAGTTAAALAAGAPSVIVPHMADQPYWGRRVAALGVGPRPIPRHRLTVPRLAAAIREATDDPAIRRRAAELGARIRDEDGLGEAVARIREVVQP
jgi:UDP:flavonoid glycosyltransferase YjiC (YdhE family)